MRLACNKIYIWLSIYVNQGRNQSIRLVLTAHECLSKLQENSKFAENACTKEKRSDTFSNYLLQGTVHKRILCPESSNEHKSEGNWFWFPFQSTPCQPKKRLNRNHISSFVELQQKRKVNPLIPQILLIQLRRFTNQFSEKINKKKKPGQQAFASFNLDHHFKHPNIQLC